MLEREFLNVFIQKLIEAGFPQSSIAVEYKLHNNPSSVIIDIGIVDLITNELLLIFEIKVLHEKRSCDQLKRMAQMQLLNYINQIGNPRIPVYLVVAKSSTDFEIFPFQLDEDGKRVFLPAVSIKDLMSYSILSNGSMSAAIEIKAKEIKQTTDWFKIICWLCAILAVALAVLDNLKIITINSTQLALIGVAIALLIMPFSKKLKILGVEFERLTAEKKDSKSK